MGAPGPTAALNPGDIAYPIRAALANQRNARVLLAAATSIDAANRRVVLDDGALAYDYLVVATGATHSYFGRDDWAQVAPGLKSVEDALEIRRRIFLAYEAAERESDPAAQREWLTFAEMQGGRSAATRERPAFRYHDKGNMATIGRAEAVIATKHFARHGLFAWLLWWAVHIAFLVGFRNRLLMMFHWGWSWLTFKRGARLITGSIGALPPIRSIGPDGQVALPPGTSAVTLEDSPSPPAPPPPAPP